MTHVHLIKTWGIAISIWLGGQVLFFNEPTLIQKLLEQQIVVYSFIAAITAVFWHGINRLNTLDDLDGLKNSHIKIIRSKVASLKKILHNRVMSLILSTLLLFLLTISKEHSTLATLILEQELILIFSALWLYGSTYPSLFQTIDTLRQTVSDIKFKEKNRQQLIAEIIRERQENPLGLEENVEKIKTPLNSNKETF